MVNVEAGLTLGSILGPLLFLTHTNDLSQNLVSNPKLFSDDTSFFSVLFGNDLSAENLHDDLNRIKNWAFQWKMSFNPDPISRPKKLFFLPKFKNYLNLH